MSFASKLQEYCKDLDCTNKAIAQACGLSPAALSRYLSGERVPEPNGPMVQCLANGIAKLSEESGHRNPLVTTDVLEALEAELTASDMIGLDFNMRLNAIMDLDSMRNADVAEVAGVDPSYISRIRRGQRTPANIHTFAKPIAQLAAHQCVDQNLLDDLGELVETSDFADEGYEWNLDSESFIGDIIEVWLTGSQIFQSDTAKLDALLKWYDSTDFSAWLSFCSDEDFDEKERPTARARFYYGVGGMRSAELDFLATAAAHRVHELALSTDLPLMQMDPDTAFLRQYQSIIQDVLRYGGFVNVVYNVERPLAETIRSLRLWTPFYITGHVSPYFLRGMYTQLFYHVNYVCDVCALSAEAITGHAEEGRYYYTTRPEDVSYYQKKMRLVLGKAFPLLEIYRSCDPEQQEAFEKAEAARSATGRGKAIGAERFQNLRVVSYPGNCTVLTIRCGADEVHFVIKHPKINYVVSHMK